MTEDSNNQANGCSFRHLIKLRNQLQMPRNLPVPTNEQKAMMAEVLAMLVKEGTIRYTGSYSLKTLALPDPDSGDGGPRLCFNYIGAVFFDEHERTRRRPGKNSYDWLGPIVRRRQSEGRCQCCGSRSVRSMHHNPDAAHIIEVEWKQCDNCYEVWDVS